MAVTPFKTFSAGEILTASDLNSSFSQITDNGEDLGSPRTKAFDLDGQSLILDGDGDTSITADTDDRVDINIGGVDLFRFDGTTASSVNGLDFTSSATGNDVVISSVGSDSNIDIALTPKGTGTVVISTQLGDGTKIEAADDGADVNLVIGNSAGSGSTDETISLLLQHNSVQGGKIVSGRIADYSSDANEDSYLAFFTSQSGTDTEVFRADELGKIFINETANAEATGPSLTINMGATASAGDEVLALKQPDVAHGTTDVTETDTFFTIRPDTTAGGATVAGFAGAQNLGLRISAYAQSEDAGKTVTSGGRFVFQSFHTSGTATTDSGANTNLFVWQHRSSAALRNAMILDAEGDLHVDGSGSLSTFDTFDDAALIRAVDVARAPETIIQTRWDEFVDYNKDDLVAANILGAGEKPLLNVTQLQRLHNGAIWQQHNLMNYMAEVIEEMLPGFGKKMREKLREDKLPMLPALRVVQNG